MLAHVVDGMLDSAEDNYRSLREARGRPHVLDDATVNRVVEVYTAVRRPLALRGTVLPVEEGNPDSAAERGSGKAE